MLKKTEDTPVRHPLIELTSVRTKEFLRETEALFWVFGFPLLLALALGFAFRSKPPDRIPIGVVEGLAAKQRMAALSQSPALLPRVYSEREGREALRSGKISLLIEGDAALVYRYDATRPDARTARMKKLLKRLVATPMRKSHYLIAQFLSRLIFLVFEVFILVAFGWIVFHVRVNGSIALLTFLCLLGGFAFAGIGLLTASRAKTLEAVSGMMNLVMMPMWLCSGVFFSYERFPDSVKPVIRALPLTALNDALRGVMNDAAAFTAVLPQIAILL